MRIKPNSRTEESNIIILTASLGPLDSAMLSDQPSLYSQLLSAVSQAIPILTESQFELDFYNFMAKRFLSCVDHIFLINVLTVPIWSVISCLELGCEYCLRWDPRGLAFFCYSSVPCMHFSCCHLVTACSRAILQRQELFTVSDYAEDIHFIWLYQYTNVPGIWWIFSRYYFSFPCHLAWVLLMAIKSIYLFSISK